MVIPRVEVEAVGATASDLLLALKELYPKRLPRRIAREVVPRAERLLDRLVEARVKPYPRRVYHTPFKWSDNPIANAKARRWWYANKRGRHQRTGRLKEAWKAEVNYTPADQQIVVEIRNDAPGASYVYGAAEFGYRQVPSHAATGWINTGTVVTDVALDVGIEIEAGIAEVTQDELTKFARKGR